MQLFCPYSQMATMISSEVGVYTQDGIVQYIHGGLPIFAHAASDLNYFRFIICNLLERNLCRKTDIAKCFNIGPDFVYTAHKQYKQFGPDAFLV